jgi:hypothetical protein
MTKKFLLVLVFGFCGLVCAAAHDYRVFYFVRDKHGMHGPIASNPTKPYAGSLQAGSRDEARRMVLKEEPNAVQIEINQLD